MKGLQEDLEGDRELLSRNITHDIKSAGQTEKGRGTATGDIPMLSEEEERKHSIDALSANTLG